jgi:hypothetical protein
MPCRRYFRNRPSSGNRRACTLDLQILKRAMEIISNRHKDSDLDEIKKKLKEFDSKFDRMEKSWRETDDKLQRILDILQQSHSSTRK